MQRQAFRPLDPFQSTRPGRPLRKNVPHSRGMKMADLHVKDFRLEGIRNVIIDVTLRGEFHGSCSDPARNGEASYADPNGAIDAAVKAKLDNYQHDYSARNFLFLQAVMTTSARISGDFLRLLCILAQRPCLKHLTRRLDGGSLFFIETSTFGRHIVFWTASPWEGLWTPLHLVTR